MVEVAGLSASPVVGAEFLFQLLNLLFRHLRLDGMVLVLSFLEISFQFRQSCPFFTKCSIVRSRLRCASVGANYFVGADKLQHRHRHSG